MVMPLIMKAANCNRIQNCGFPPKARKPQNVIQPYPAYTKNGILYPNYWRQPSTAPLSIIIFERMLLISAVLSLISAVVAILTVTLSRRRFAKQTGSAYVPNHIVAMTIILFHLSMFLFLVGLVTFFLAIHKIVAAVVSVAVGVLYLTLTILSRQSSYRTPLSRSLATIVFHSPL
ncbi:hypothetical protein BGY98DRAFT_961536 [Russula aff. rugulosa BPL654]|nr:hypothetical protein BGY98DRAFT_961536 [Russula aff. rugulosa BPL654]